MRDAPDYAHPITAEGTVYLLHFERPLHHARHYLGFTTALDERLEAHRAGRGARLVEVFTALGIGFEVVRTWRGDRHFERRLKRQKHSWKHCPRCRAERGRAT